MPKADRLSEAAIKLLKEKQIAHFVTLMPNGDPQVTPVWIDVEDDGSHVLINTADGRVKDRNVERDDRVAVSVADGQNFERAVSIRGRIVERRKEGAIDSIHGLSRKYRGRDYTFDSEAEAQARVIFRIKPYAVIERNLGS
jgi:PPOX class probable F420-dependent enzyme